MWHDYTPPPEEESDELEPEFNPVTEGDIDPALETDEIEVILDLPLVLFNSATMEAAEPLEEEKES